MRAKRSADGTAQAVPPGDAASRPTTEAQQAIAGIVARIEARFSPVGDTLAELVPTTETALSTIAILQGVLGQDGDDSPAAAALLQIARSLQSMPARQADRQARIGRLGDVVERLKGFSAEIARTLTELRFYTVNLKIVAAGSAEFVEFAKDMGARLVTGQGEVESFDRQVDQMRLRLREMRTVGDDLLDACARVVPQVPDRLLEKVEELRCQQVRLERTAAGARATVLRLQGNVASALGTMQIGDITRQRFEHVHHGLAALDATPGLSTAWSHMVSLLADQTADLGSDFARQSRLLQDTLGALAPDCEALLAQLKGPDATPRDAAFLQDLRTSIAEARTMTGRLHHANGKALEMTQVILAVVDLLAQRFGSIEDLRYEVDYLAINVTLRARRDPALGHAVAVIACEIRLSARRLADLIGSVMVVADQLRESSADFSWDLGRSGADDFGSTLDRALDLVSRALTDSDAAMADLEARARAIAARIDLACEELAACRGLSDAMGGIVEQLAQKAGETPAIAHDELPAATAFMEQFALTYTMASERAVHNRHLLPGMTMIGSIPQSVSLDDPVGLDDDALFDDALF